MALTIVGIKYTPTYLALSSDIADNKITGASIIGATVFLTDTSVWKIVSVDLTLKDYSPPA